MKKFVVAVAAAAAMLSAVATSGTAEAQERAIRSIGTGVGTAVGAGVGAVGAGVGAAAGAVATGTVLFGSAALAALDPRYHPYAPVEGYYYVDGQRYSAKAPIGCPNGFWGYRVSAGKPQGEPRWVCPPKGYTARSYAYR